MKIKGFKREEKRFKDKYRMRYHGILGLSKAERIAKKKLKKACALLAKPSLCN